MQHLRIGHPLPCPRERPPGFFLRPVLSGNDVQHVFPLAFQTLLLDVLAHSCRHRLPAVVSPRQRTDAVLPMHLILRDRRNLAQPSRRLRPVQEQRLHRHQITASLTLQSARKQQARITAKRLADVILGHVCVSSKLGRARHMSQLGCTVFYRCNNLFFCHNSLHKKTPDLGVFGGLV